MTRFPNGLNSPLIQSDAATLAEIAAEKIATDEISTDKVTIGAGTPVTMLKIYSVEATPAEVAANTTAEQDIVVTGVLATDIVLAVTKPTAQAGLGIVGVRVKAADTVAVVFSNNTAVAITPTAEEIYQFTVISL